MPEILNSQHNAYEPIAWSDDVKPIFYGLIVMDLCLDLHDIFRLVEFQAFLWNFTAVIILKWLK